MLTHYQLPQGMEEKPQCWDPSSEDAHVLNGENGWFGNCRSTHFYFYTVGHVHESFESHPAFHLPIGGYMLNLAINQHDDDAMLQEFVEALQKQLRRYKSQCLPSIEIDYVNCDSPFSWHYTSNS